MSIRDLHCNSLTACCCLHAIKNGRRIFCSKPASRWFIVGKATVAAFCNYHGPSSIVQKISFEEAIIWQVMHS